jgi:hypothetical protein
MMEGIETLIRCSSLGKIMTEPKLKSEVLSEGAKTAIETIAGQAIFGIQFEVDSKQMAKGLICEQSAIDLLCEVRGLSLMKNAERKRNDWLTGEADLVGIDRGHDLKCSWSAATFPIVETSCYDKLYEWQMRGYMMLWDVGLWEVNYALVNTPEHLIGYEPQSMHFFDHIPMEHRITTWAIARDVAKEKLIIEKCKLAVDYLHRVLDEFDRTHRIGAPAHVARQAFVAKRGDSPTIAVIPAPNF